MNNYEEDPDDFAFSAAGAVLVVAGVAASFLLGVLVIDLWPF